MAKLVKSKFAANERNHEKLARYYI